MKRIIVENLSKKFHLDFNRKHTVLSQIISAFSGKETVRDFFVLKNITFTVNSGEILGVIGPNGAGKSTLLGIIAGIYEKDEGTMKVHGKVIPVNGLWRGLKDHLTTRENIYLIGALYGLHSRTIHKREEDILLYAKLEEYCDTKIYQLSTGMVGRLIFSIAIHCEPDILLLDEVNSHLDKEFNAKVTATVNELTERGIAIVIVSHTQWVIEHCDRVLWLDKGSVVMEAGSKDVIKEYFK